MQTPSASPETPKRNPCYERTERYCYALGVTADDGQTFWFAAAQWLQAEQQWSPLPEEGAGGPAERLQIRYATGEITILGTGLNRLARMLQRGELESIRPVGNRYAGLQTSGSIISSITVTRKEEG
jgi:hypothetical protein